MVIRDLSTLSLSLSLLKYAELRSQNEHNRESAKSIFRAAFFKYNIFLLV